MTTINLTALKSTDSVSKLFCIANTSTEGILMLGFIIALFFIILLVLKRWEFDKALLVSSWSCFILSLIATTTTCWDGTRLISTFVAITFLAIASLTAMFIWMNET